MSKGNEFQDMASIDDVISLLEKHGMQKATFDASGNFAGVWFIRKSVIALALEEAGGFSAFIRAYVRERLFAETGYRHEETETEAPCGSALESQG